MCKRRRDLPDATDLSPDDPGRSREEDLSPTLAEFNTPDKLFVWKTRRVTFGCDVEAWLLKNRRRRRFPYVLLRRSIGMTYYSRDSENPADIHGGTFLSVRWKSTTILGVVTGLIIARPRTYTRARRGYRLAFKRWVSNFSRKIANAVNRKTHSNNAINVAKKSCLRV